MIDEAITEKGHGSGSRLAKKKTATLTTLLGTMSSNAALNLGSLHSARTIPFYSHSHKNTCTHTKGVRMVVTTPSPKIRMLWALHRHFELTHAHTYMYSLTHTYTHTHSHTHTHTCTHTHIQTFITCTCGHSAHSLDIVLCALLSLFNPSPNFHPNSERALSLYTMTQ